MANVFVSYARDDFEVAERVVSALRAAALEPWWDQDLAPPGGNFLDEAIAREIDAASHFIALLSPCWLARTYTRGEAVYAKAKAKHLVPVRILAFERNEAPIDFLALHWCDLCTWDGTPTDPQIRRLAAACGADVPHRDFREQTAAPTARSDRTQVIQNITSRSTAAVIGNHKGTIKINMSRAMDMSRDTGDADE